MASDDITRPIWIIYLITCLPTSKRYVGLTRKGLHHRWRKHKGQAFNKNSSTPLARAMRRYGVDAFSMETLSLTDTYKEACEAEIAAIRHYDTRIPNGLNLAKGGGGGFPTSEATKRKISLKLTGKKRTPEQCKQMSEARRRYPSCRPSAQTIAKRVAKTAGLKRTPEQRARMSLADRLRSARRRLSDPAIKGFRLYGKRRWQTRLGGKHLGYFATAEEARAAFLVAARDDLMRLEAEQAALPKV